MCDYLGAGWQAPQSVKERERQRGGGGPNNRDQSRVYARTGVGGEAGGSEFKNSLGYLGREQSGLHETL